MGKNRPATYIRRPSTAAKILALAGVVWLVLAVLRGLGVIHE